MKNTLFYNKNSRLINQLLFYGALGIAIFSVSFICLNFSAFYLRWTARETHGQITYDKPGKVSFPSFNFSGNPSDISSNTASGQTAIQETDYGLGPAIQNQKANYNPGPNTIIIAKLNVRAPLVQPADSSQNEINTALNQGVVLYPGSALPGQAGEVFLTGHSSVFPWNKTKYGHVFTLLDKLQAGDTISLVYNNYQHDYRIIRKEILNPDAVKINSTNEPTLTLMTCWPIGTALKRLVVYGELIE